jgi:phage gp46-like protein
MSDAGARLWHTQRKADLQALIIRARNMAALDAGGAFRGVVR